MTSLKGRPITCDRHLCVVLRGQAEFVTDEDAQGELNSLTICASFATKVALFYEPVDFRLMQQDLNAV